MEETDFHFTVATGDWSIVWEHGERYHEGYGGVIEFAGVFGLCDEYRLWEHRAERGRTVERKAPDLSYEWSPDDDEEEDAERYVPDPSHTVRLMKGERIIVAHCTAPELRQWEGPAYITGVTPEMAFMYVEGVDGTKTVVEGEDGGPKTMRLGDLLDEALETMRETCRQYESETYTR